MTYTIRWRPSAERDLAGLPPELRKRIGKWIGKLAKNPRPSGIVAIKGQPSGNYRGRVGDYRIGFEVIDAEATV